MTLRAPRDDDFDAMLELMNAHQLAAFGEADVTADELAHLADLALGGRSSATSACSSATAG